MTRSFLPNNAFPLPVLISPKLVALGLDNETAATVSKIYLSSALTLKQTYESEYISACEALLATSDNRGYSSKELRAKLLTVSAARYSQALSKWMEDVVQKAGASVLKRSKKPTPQRKVMSLTTTPLPNGRERQSWPRSKNDSAKVESISFHTNSPPHAFPNSYPPPVGPAPIAFVTHIPLLMRGPEREPRATSDCDIDACTAALARLSLEPPSSRNPSSRKPSKIVTTSRTHTRTTSSLKLTSQLSPSRPRLVSPALDTSVAVPHKPLPKHAPPPTSPTNSTRTQNIDIPRSDRRKACSIPYRRPTMHSPTTPESAKPLSFSPSIQRIPSLVSDHGSEASSPSTSPDFSSMPVYAPSIDYKSTFPEATFLFGDSAICYPGEYDIDFGTDIYG